MTTVSIPLPDDQVSALRLRADQAGIPLEEYLARGEYLAHVTTTCHASELRLRGKAHGRCA